MTDTSAAFKSDDKGGAVLENVYSKGSTPMSSHRDIIDIPRDEERRMLRKFDFLLLPPLAFMFVYFFGKY